VKLVTGSSSSRRLGLTAIMKGHPWVVSRTDDAARNEPLPMSTIRLDMAYHGARFSGWAAQPGERTVQGELEAALERLLGSRTPLTVAGRTDAGVHAWGQVASYVAEKEPPEELGGALNSLTGPDLAVLEATHAADGFDARRDARSRTYCYRVLVERTPNPFESGVALHWQHRVDDGALAACTDALIGTHDFTAFTPTQTEHVRFERDILRAEWHEKQAVLGHGRVLELWIEADAFMRNMVRVLVGTMLEVGGGRRSLDDFGSLLAGAPRDQAGDTAPAHGLHLASVRY
jgi:tRNA pseudouridine38-40 synthase